MQIWCDVLCGVPQYLMQVTLFKKKKRTCKTLVDAKVSVKPFYSTVILCSCLVPEKKGTGYNFTIVE